jgi:hypothetical protein
MLVKDFEVEQTSSYEFPANLSVVARENAVTRMDAHVRTASAHLRESLCELLDVDRDRLWENDGFRSLEEWLGARYDISSWEASLWIHAAYALEDLPYIAAALSSGLLGLDKVLQLCRLATPETEQKLIKWARNVAPSTIRKRADRHQQAEFDAGAVHDSRYLRMWDVGQGFSFIEGMIPTLEANKLRKSLDRVAKRLPDMPPREDGTVPDERTRLEQKHADALGLLAEAELDGDTVPGTVVAFLDENPDGTTVTYLENGTVLHPDVRDRLLCSAKVQPVAIGKDGDIGIGAASQITTPWLRRIVTKETSGKCFFPGCERSDFLQPHHLEHWTRTHETNKNNLRLVCSSHHTLLHEGRWSAVLDQEGNPIVFRPSGRRYEPGVPGSGESLDEIAHDERHRMPRTQPGPIERDFGIKNYEFQALVNERAEDLMKLAMYEQGYWPQDHKL